MKKVYILAFTALLGQSSWAQIREFQTTRLNSTAGAGVASVLSTEAALLNPATAAYFDGSSFSYQSYTTSLRHTNDQRDAANDDFPGTNKSQGFFITDQSGPVKGGVSYLLQDENNYERTQMVMHGAAPIGKQTAMGFSYSYIQDKKPRSFSPSRQIHHRASLGLLHILDTSTTLGLVIVDPTRTTPNEERVIAGFQYNLADKFTLIGDIGTQYTRAVTKKYLWRGAVQLNLFDDFFLRVGKFYDNVREFKGTGWGAGWIGPRLGVEFAQKFSEQFGKTSYIYQDETLVDTSLSLIIKF